MNIFFTRIKEMAPLAFQNIVFGFVSQHKAWVATNFGLMIVHFPIELIVLSYLSGQIFIKMSTMRTNTEGVVRLSLLFFLCYFIIEVFAAIRDTYDSYVVPQLEKQIRNHIIDTVLNKNEINFDNLDMGEVIARFLKTPSYTYVSYLIMTKHVVPFVAAVIVVGFYVFYLNRKVGIVYLIIFSIYLITFWWLCKIMLIQTEKRMIAEMLMFSQIEDTLSNIHTILTSNKTMEEGVHMDRCQEEFIKIHQQEMRMNTKIKMGLSVYSIMAIIGLFLYTIHLYSRRRIKKEQLVSIVTLLLFMIRFLCYTTRRIVEGMVTIGSMVESNQFVEQLRHDTFAKGTKRDFITNGKIEFIDVAFKYSSNHTPIFTNLNVSIPARSQIILMGDSGSGKTTFLRLLLGFFHLQNGKILIDGVDLNQSDRGYLRQHIGYINQSTRLFDRSIMENILYGCEGNVSRESILQFAKDHHLDDLFNKLGDNWPEKKAGRGGENLSGGMRQIILLMRCLFRNCPIVIIDEATSSIDAKHRKYAIILIREMFRNKTVICVSHDKEIIDLFDAKLVFSSDQSPLFIVSSSNSSSF